MSLRKIASAVCDGCGNGQEVVLLFDASRSSVRRAMRKRYGWDVRAGFDMCPQCSGDFRVIYRLTSASAKAPRRQLARAGCIQG
jgi:hypothetical protein